MAGKSKKEQGRGVFGPLVGRNRQQKLGLDTWIDYGVFITYWVGVVGGDVEEGGVEGEGRKG